ncbi:MAG: ribonuclease, partial [Actinomycetota bacterium]|nr:ribonuclease [Actinomycetota bacterium]
MTSVPPASSAGDDLNRALCGGEGQPAPGVVLAAWMTGRRPQMASDDNDIFNTGSAPDAPAASAAPIKKAPAKRAPRKATKKTSTPVQAPDGASAVETAASDVTAAPPRKAAKRAPRKSAKKAAAALPDLDSAQTAPAQTAPAQSAPAEVPPAPVSPASPAPAQADHAPEPEPEKASAAQNFGLLFQPPAPTEAPRRRRATAPVAAPAPEPAEAQQSPSSAVADQPDEAPQDAKGSNDSNDPDDSGASGGAPRRRRRGGKGRRGRASGESTADDSGTSSTTGVPNDDDQSGADDAESKSSNQSNQSKSSDQPSAEDSESAEGGESHRRTRRRRRGSAGEGDDQQSGSSTTTRVREPRPKRDEVTSVKGSTRLEAKKLRRREGREAGRRRTVITEAEFLARRESVERVMVVRHKEDRTQIGVLEDGVLVEHYVSRETNASMAGNVYLGRIQNVLPSMEAAFVDIGKGRNAVLYAGEVNWDAAGLDNNRAKRIENALSSGQGVLVQVTKDPIGHKGARLTSQVSLPGRYLVYVPDGNMMGISRKLPDTERARLKKILREVVPENAGVIVRTAAEGASEDELRADVNRLTAAWEDIQAKAKHASAPALLHGEPDLTVRVIRDVFNEDFAKLVAAGDPAWDAVSGYVNTVAPDLAGRIQKWTGEQDLFTHYRVDEQIAKAMDRKVWLPSGGSLVIDRTEAMTVVDVNTGKFVGS